MWLRGVARSGLPPTSFTKEVLDLLRHIEERDGERRRIARLETQPYFFLLFLRATPKWPDSANA